MKKSLLFLTLCSLTFAPILGSCNGNNESDEIVDVDAAKVNVVYNKEGGSVTYSDIDYKVGQKLVLTVEENKGYFLAYVKINGETIRSHTTKYIYEIIDNVVNVEVSFVKIEVNFTDITLKTNEEDMTATISSYNPVPQRIPSPFVVPENVIKNGKTYKIIGIEKGALNISGADKIVLNKNISYFPDGTLSTIYGLQEIEVVKENPYFASKDGVLYSKDFKTLLGVPTEYKQKSFTIPDTVNTVKSFAFCNVRLIEDVTVSDSVTKLEANAFNSMKSLMHIKLSKNITEIPDFCFTGCVYLQGIKLPEGIIKIGEAAFKTCTAMLDVNYPSSLKEIGKEAFYECKLLDDPVLNEGLEVIGNSAFGQCQSFVNVKLPSTLLKLDDVAFEGCQILRHVTLNKGLKYLGGAVFYKNPSLKDVTIPNTVETIAYNPFMGTGNAKLILEEGNKNYTMVDGILYSKDLTKLICVPYYLQPADLTYRIPDSVVELGYNAISLNIYLRKIIIPVSVKKMNCSFFATLPTPNSKDPYLLEIYYEGTAAEFRTIDTSGYEWNYGAYFKGNVLHCKDKDINLA